MCYARWPGEQWRYAVNVEEGKEIEVKMPRKTEMEAGEDNSWSVAIRKDSKSRKRVENTG